MYFVTVQSLLPTCRLRDLNMEGWTDPSIARTTVDAHLSF
jgi:hypothetical protein